MGDKRRYTSKSPSPQRDKIVGMDSDISGNAATDGFSTRYRNPLKRSERYNSDSLYREKYACEGLMDDEDARMQELFGTMPGDY